MIRYNKDSLKNNPVYFSDSRTIILEEALNSFLQIFQEYASKNDFSSEQINLFNKLIMDFYTEKRAAYFLESSLDKFSENIDRAFCNALRKTFEKDDKEDFTKVFYYSDKQHRLVNNEH